MTTAHRMQNNVRSFLSVPLQFFLSIYVLTLTCSIAGMEMASWATSFFVILYIFSDRLNSKRELELHTIGVEIPLVGFIIVVILGLRLNAPDSDFLAGFGIMRNLALIFFLAYGLQVVRNLNRLMALLTVAGTAVAVYAIWQHFTGVDIWGHLPLEKMPWGDVYESVGFFGHHLTFGHSFMMILCIPWAALLLARRAPWWHLGMYALSIITILTSLIFAYGRGVWIAVLLTLPLMAFFASRKLFLVTVAFLVFGGSIVLKFSPVFRERVLSVFSENYESNEDRKKLWHINFEMFHDHPWIGVGYKQNEPLSPQYFDKLGIKDGVPGNAHSNYVQLLSTTGIIGFAFYMLTIIAFILMTARLYAIIPNTHYWHKVFALAALGAQVAFHVGGLTNWSFGDPEVLHQFIFWLAVVSYMSQKYFVHIVPDDRSL